MGQGGDGTRQLPYKAPMIQPALPHCHPIQELQNTPYETLPSQLAKKKNVSIRVWHLSIWYEGSKELNSFKDSPWACTHACTCTHTLMHFRTCTHPPIQPIAQSCICTPTDTYMLQQTFTYTIIHTITCRQWQREATIQVTLFFFCCFKAQTSEHIWKRILHDWVGVGKGMTMLRVIFSCFKSWAIVKLVFHQFWMI